MQMHPRDKVLGEAELKLSETFVLIVNQFNLTPLEVQHILNQEAARWVRFAIREERSE